MGNSLSVEVNFLVVFHALPLKCAVHNSQQLRQRAYRGRGVGGVDGVDGGKD